MSLHGDFSTLRNTTSDFSNADKSMFKDRSKSQFHFYQTVRKRNTLSKSVNLTAANPSKRVTRNNSIIIEEKKVAAAEMKKTQATMLSESIRQSMIASIRNEQISEQKIYNEKKKSSKIQVREEKVSDSSSTASELVIEPQVSENANQNPESIISRLMLKT